MPLLSLKNLTVRFGGLTAVSEVDCGVDAGQIFSIIGPNGAGKTTVFNTISGLYRPTEGAIEFAGPPLERPFTPAVLVRAIVFGLITGLGAFFFSSDLDGLWAATIKRNYMERDEPFDRAGARRDFFAYFRGDLAVEHRGRRWLVVTADGRQQLSNEPDRDAALVARDRLQALVTALAARGTAAATVRSENAEDYAVAFDGQSFPLGRFGAPALAERQLARLQKLAAAMRPRTYRIVGGAALGFVVGFAGALSVWRRSRRTPEVIALAGIGRTFQNIRLFRHLSVLDNVLVACDRRLRGGAWQMAVCSPAVQKEEAAAARHARELLAFVGLSGNFAAPANSLPYGDQRRLEIARALAAEPTLLLLDEPAAGMNPSESTGLASLIGRIRDRGLTVLLIEHHMRVVMGISDRIAVLDHGVKIGEGTPGEIRANPAVINAYLGSEEVT